MVKLWFVSFERARAESAKISIFLTVLFFAPLGAKVDLGSLVPSCVAADAMPSAKASPSQEFDFLALPAFDLDRVIATPSNTPTHAGPHPEEQDEGGVRVGDTLILKISNLSLSGIKDPAKELFLSAPPSINLHDHGWNIEFSPSNKSSSQNGSGQNGSGDFVFQATPLKSGKLILPSLVLKDAAEKAIARTNPYELEVTSAIQKDDPKPDQAEDIEPPVGLQFPGWIILVVALLFILSVIGVIYALKRWQSGKVAKLGKVPEVVRSADEIALINLVELEKMGFIERGEFKAYYFRLSEILKAYVGGRYRFDAPECTTREMIGYLEDKKALGNLVIDRLELLFEKLDLVKFTDHFPEREEPVALIQQAREFVESTRSPVENRGDREIR